MHGRWMCIILCIYCSLSTTHSFKAYITGDCTDSSGLWYANNDFMLKCLGSFLTCSGTLTVPDVHEALCVLQAYTLCSGKIPRKQKPLWWKSFSLSIFTAYTHDASMTFKQAFYTQPTTAPQTDEVQRYYVIMAGGHLLGHTCVISSLGLFSRIWAWVWAVLTHSVKLSSVLYFFKHLDQSRCS